MGTLADRETFSADPMTRGLHAATTRDIDEQAALLSGWNQTYDQMCAGRFSGSLLEFQVDNVRLFREQTSNSLHQTGKLPSQTIAIGVPIALCGRATFCGQPCDGSQVHVFSGNDAFEFFSPRGLDIAGFVLSEDDLRGSLTYEETESVMQSLANPHLRLVHRGAADQLRQIFADVYDVISSSPECISDGVRMSSMARDLRSSVAATLTYGHSNRVEFTASRRALVVRNTRQLVTEWPDRYARVEELCGALGVSRRTLQISFQETLGIKPSAYLVAVRLNGARRSIKYVRSVAEAATSWGFWHFGRFAQYYQSMFGELPSETFRRHHGPK
jgi:AraC family transcriptional regulator, ethanolamine operon transcriptional activator